MRTFPILTLGAAAFAAAVCVSGGVLEKATTIQVDPTVVEHPENVDDNVAPNLVRYDLRAAVRDAHFEEGKSAIRVHMVLDEFSSESRARKVVAMGSGHSVCTVDGKLVFEDAGGKELASVKIHVHGSVVAVQGDAVTSQTRQAQSDLERRFLQEIETLK